MKYKKLLIFSLKIAMSVGAIALIFYYLDTQKLVEIFGQFNVLYLLPIIILILANIFLFVLNYWYFLEKKFPLITGSFEYLIVWAFSLFLPGKIGELGIVPVLKKKYGISYSLGTITNIIPKISLFIVLFIFMLIGLSYSNISFSIKSEVVYFGIALVAAAIICTAALKLDMHKKIIKSIKWIQRIDETKKILSAKNLWITSVIAFLRFITFFGSTYIAFAAFNSYPDISILSIAIAVSQISVFLPISLNGLGIREVTFIAIMNFSTTSPEISLGVATITLFVNYLMAIGIIAIWNVPKRMHSQKSTKWPKS